MVHDNKIDIDYLKVKFYFHNLELQMFMYNFYCKYQSAYLLKLLYFV